jgi:hypothetical protein
MQTFLLVPAGRCFETFVAQITVAEQPDSSKIRTQLIDKTLRYGGKNFAEVETGCHLKGDFLKINACNVCFHIFLPTTRGHVLIQLVI